jgi:hypothetical protein
VGPRVTQRGRGAGGQTSLRRFLPQLSDERLYLNKTPEEQVRTPVSPFHPLFLTIKMFPRHLIREAVRCRNYFMYSE